MRLWRKRDEPPGIWRGKPRIYARWKVDGTTFVLVTVNHSYDYHDNAGRIVLEYEARGRLPGITAEGEQ